MCVLLDILTRLDTQKWLDDTILGTKTYPCMTNSIGVHIGLKS